MTQMETRFIEPLDVLILRGNKLFGDPGSYGESVIPPWPSVAAGAIRSRMLADDQVDLNAFARGQVQHPTLGTPANPGGFTLAGFHLARRMADGSLERLMAPPADLSIVENHAGKPVARRAEALRLAAGLASSAPLPLHAVLAETTRAKATSGYWLTEPGWALYLHGELPTAHDLVKSSDLWRIDERIGVGLAATTRSAEEGKLFSTQAIAFLPGVGFLASVHGAMPPADGLLRLGGDGRGAAIHSIEYNVPRPDYVAISESRRCRLILSTPGLFTQGWLPNGIGQEGNGDQFNLCGVRGRLVGAAVPRAETISGWDLATWSPKPAQRVAPTGSVYWLDELDATPEALERLSRQGLWSETCEDDARRAEGFNRLALAVWR